MSKQYLVVDCMSDFKEIRDSYESLKDLLVEVVQNDLLMNCSDYDISKSCSDVLCKIAKRLDTFDWVKEELERYSYKIIDLTKLKYDLEDFKLFWGQLGNYMGNFEVCLSNIKGVIDNDKTANK
jgi:hypothetical protein